MLVDTEFYECSSGICVKMRVVTPVIETVIDDHSSLHGLRQYTWIAVRLEYNDDPDPVEFMVTENYEHYGPRLYSYEAYGSFGSL